MKTKIALAGMLFMVAGLFLYSRESPKGRVARLLGGRACVRIISAPDTVQLFLTPNFLSKLTNGPDLGHVFMPDQGINLPKPNIERIRNILLDPENYSEPAPHMMPAGDIKLRFTRGRSSIDVEFAEGFRGMVLSHDGTNQRAVDFEPGRQAFERALGPLLENQPLPGAHD